MTDEEVSLTDYTDHASAPTQREMVFTMVLNKTANYTDIIYCGEGAKEAAEAAFGPADSDYIRCEGQLSRKNDFILALSKVLQP